MTVIKLWQVVLYFQEYYATAILQGDNNEIEDLQYVRRFELNR